jgi:hypothetical protein
VILSSFYTFNAKLYSYDLTGRTSTGGLVRTLIELKSFKCYATLLKASDQIIYGKSNVVSTHRLFLDPLDISTSNIIYITDSQLVGWYGIAWINNCVEYIPAMKNLRHMEVLLYKVDAPEVINS